MSTKTFVHQLHYIILEPCTNDLIGWVNSEDHANSFFLKPYDKKFAELVLKRHFKHGNVSSFVRQLHMYGFHKLPKNDGKIVSNTKIQKCDVVWHFIHPSGYFTKDASKELLSKIQRKSTGMGKDGKRKNILAPVCVSYFDSNGKPIHSQPINMFQHNLPLVDHFGNQVEISMANQLNMMNKVQGRSISCANASGNPVRAPETRAYSQPLLQTSPRPETPIGVSKQNSNPRVSHPSVESNGIYYDSSNNSSFSPASSLSLPYNSNNLQFHIQSQHNLPLPTAYNITSSTSMVSLPYGTSGLPTPPSVGYIPQRVPPPNHQPILKPSSLNGADTVPISTYDGVDRPIARPYSIDRENTQSVPNLSTTHGTYAEKTNPGVVMLVTYPLVGPVPQHSSLHAVTKLENNNQFSQDWTQPRILPLSSDNRATVVNNTSAISTPSIPKKTSEGQSLPPAYPVQRMPSNNNNNNTKRSEKESQLDKHIQTSLSTNLQDLVKSLVLTTDTLNKIHSPDRVTSPKLNIKSDDSGKVNIELDGRQIELDQLLNMLSELKTKLIDNNDVISKTLMSKN